MDGKYVPKNEKRPSSGTKRPNVIGGSGLIFQSLCQSVGLPKPTPEYEFAKDAGRKWRIDWYFEANGKRLALEVEGGVHTGGRHTRGTGFMGDMEKYNAMTCRGIWLLRTTPSKLLSTETINLIRTAIYGTR